MKKTFKVVQCEREDQLKGALSGVNLDGLAYFDGKMYRRDRLGQVKGYTLKELGVRCEICNFLPRDGTENAFFGRLLVLARMRDIKPYSARSYHGGTGAPVALRDAIKGGRPGDGDVSGVDSHYPDNVAWTLPTSLQSIELDDAVFAKAESAPQVPLVRDRALSAVAHGEQLRLDDGTIVRVFLGRHRQEQRLPVGRGWMLTTRSSSWSCPSKAEDLWEVNRLGSGHQSYPTFGGEDSVYLVTGTVETKTADTSVFTLQPTRGGGICDSRARLGLLPGFEHGDIVTVGLTPNQWRMRVHVLTRPGPLPAGRAWSIDGSCPPDQEHELWTARSSDYLPGVYLVDIASKVEPGIAKLAKVEQASRFNAAAFEAIQGTNIEALRGAFTGVDRGHIPAPLTKTPAAAPAPAEAYILWNPASTKTPTRTWSSLSQVQAIAIRMASREPGQTFNVCRIVEEITAEKPVEPTIVRRSR